MYSTHTHTHLRVAYIVPPLILANYKNKSCIRSITKHICIVELINFIVIIDRDENIILCSTKSIDSISILRSRQAYKVEASQSNFFNRNGSRPVLALA